jgi:MFS family permease
LLSDYFGRAERSRAISRYFLGWPIALIVGNVVAGWLNEMYGWRATFVLIGLPGLLLAALAAFALGEPRLANTSRAMPPNTSASATEPSLKNTVVHLWANSAYRHLLYCHSLVSFFTYGILQWQPAFFIRSYGLQTGELGVWLALMYGVGGLIGTYIGGELAGRYAADNERLQLRAIAVAFVIATILLIGVYVAPNHRLALAALGIYAIVSAATNGPLFATTQAVVPARMRAISIAIILFFGNLIGMGFGPVAAGSLSDALGPTLHEESLRYALVVFCPGYLWCGWHAWRASRGAREVAAAQADDEASAAALMSSQRSVREDPLDEERVRAS